MKRFLSAAFAAALYVWLFLLGPSLFAQAFEWSLAAVDKKRSAALPVSRPVSMRNGDTVSFLISTAADCHVYIIAQDADRNVTVVYSGPLPAGQVLESDPVQIIAPAGTETFHLIVSREKDPALESRIEMFRKSGAFRDGRNVANAALDFRRSISALKEAPERPVQMGGAFRGFNQDLEGVAYSGAEKYFKSIVINH
ncbi:hypothetical protein [Leadbettera azotonutricia]|uniref:DUF4384 domain-containing protein n=1 Tax=Leadbettera azotonutricia (strain ATCC BAA-888 / DSM 13862 / ZAS-9) TaxID=545695 RepID=F5Y6W6_LEAAZ|nr:hypothetical protein [Leadbettera azotonutricia]AEF82458.1 hypothetical protein TREAZ_3593 [Leadbettera azotonutricia ZAS-9]